MSTLRRVSIISIPTLASERFRVITLGLNTLLFVAVLATSIVLKKRYEHYARLMKEFSKEDKADPWRVDEN